MASGPPCSRRRPIAAKWTIRRIWTRPGTRTEVQRPGGLLRLRQRLALALTDRLLDDGLQLAPDVFHDFTLLLAQERLLFAELALLLAQLALLRTEHTLVRAEHTLVRAEVRLLHGEVGRQPAGGCLNLRQMGLHLRQGIAVDLCGEFVQVQVVQV